MLKKYNESLDFYFSSNGDFCLDDTGMLKDTKNDKYRYFIQRVNNRLSSTHGDWSLAPRVGANLTDFLGSPNTAATGESIRRRVYTELTRDGFVSGKDLKVEVIPLSQSSVGIIINVTPPDTTSQVVLTYSYDYRDNKIVPRNS
jgi:hypothetical protein